MRLAMLLSILSMLFMISCGEDPVQVKEISKKTDRSGDVSKTELCQMESFEIYGDNFDKYAETIQVLFNDTPVQILNVSKDALLISIPETQDSVGTLTVLKGSDSVKIDHEIRIKPEICVDVTSLLKYEVAPGEVLLGKGNGLGKYKGVMTAIIESQEANLEVISDSECTVNIPKLNYGTYEIKFLVGTEVVGEFKILVKGEADNLDFEITTVEPREVYRGDVFTVRGKGFGKEYENCTVLVESYTLGAFEKAELVSLSDNKIEAKVPFEALLGECKVKVIVGGITKISPLGLIVVTSEYDYSKLYLNMESLEVNMNIKGIIHGEKDKDYYEYYKDELNFSVEDLDFNTSWKGDSIVWENLIEGELKTGKIILDSINNKVKYFEYKNKTKYEIRDKHGSSSSDVIYRLSLENIPYQIIDDKIKIFIDKNSVPANGFDYYYSGFFRFYPNTLIDEYTMTSTDEYKFSDDFKLTIILSK